MSEENDLAIEPFDPAAPDEATELRALKRALAMSQGFRMLFVVCNLPNERRRLMQALSEQLPKLKAQELIFDGPIHHLLDELRARLTESPNAVFVSGLENSITSDDDPRRVPLIANLNAARNSFPSVAPCPVVLWVPQYVLHAILQGAPDFFSIRSGTYYFAATPQNTIALSQSLTAGEEGAAISLPIANKLERIAAIRSLLNDYQSLPKAQRDYDAELRLLTRLGNLFISIGQAREALTTHQTCLNLSRESGDLWGEGAALGHLGNAYYALGETHRAIELYQELLPITRDTNNRKAEGTTLSNLGMAYAKLGETHRSIDFLEQAMIIAQEISDLRGEGNALINLGNAYFDLGETQRAIHLHEKALILFREIGDRRGEGAALGNLGNAYYSTGETQRAIDFYEQRIAIAREIGDQRGDGNALWNIAVASKNLNQQERAIKSAREALAIFQLLEDPNAEIVRQQLEEWQAEANGETQTES